MTKDFQDTLNKAGVPLMQLIAQEMKEKKMI